MNRTIHRLATEELAAAVRFYKKEAGAGLARRFLGQFERVANLLEQHPGLGTPSEGDRRVHPLTDFPFSIIYWHEDDTFRILVIRHQSRDPEYGESRR